MQKLAKRILIAVTATLAAIVWAAVFYGLGRNREHKAGSTETDRAGVAAPPQRPPLTDEVLDRTIGEFNSRCRATAFGPGNYAEEYCSCLFIAAAAGRTRQEGHPMCDRAARTGGGIEPSGGTAATSSTTPFPDDELDRAVGEFNARCKAMASGPGNYTSAYCSCLFAIVAAGSTRPQAHPMCDAVARTGGDAGGTAAGQSAEQQAARIMAETRSSGREFDRMTTLAQMDAWAGPEGLAIDFRDVERAVWRYVGKRVRFRGRVTYLRESPGEVLMQANVCRNGTDCNLIVWHPLGQGQHTRAREGDWIWIYGFVLDEYAYTSQAGWDLSAPRVAMVGSMIAR